MQKLAIVLAVGAAALMGGSAANAADNSVKAKNVPGVAQSSTDISAQKRHRHWRGHHHHHRHWGHRHHHRPYTTATATPRATAITAADPAITAEAPA
jgi:hypothetical protein